MLQWKDYEPGCKTRKKMDPLSPLLMKAVAPWHLFPYRLQGKRCQREEGVARWSMLHREAPRNLGWTFDMSGRKTLRFRAVLLMLWHLRIVFRRWASVLMVVVWVQSEPGFVRSLWSCPQTPRCETFGSVSTCPCYSTWVALQNM